MEGEASGTAFSVAAKGGINERTNSADSKCLGMGINPDCIGASLVPLMNSELKARHFHR
jgi:hypothetical protein